MNRSGPILVAAIAAAVPMLTAGGAQALITDALTSNGKNWDYQPYDVAIHQNALSTSNSTQNSSA